MLPEGTKITYTYTPSTWTEDAFFQHGGFTVVFLNYNKLAQIEASVASALNQDFPLLEMFFMDDASTDGSGDRMEALVRAYHGRHKVTVVRNVHNQRITGQWNIVAKLAKGNWFGMFCADDVAFSDRVTKTAERLRQVPTLRGLCTSGMEVNYITGNLTTQLAAGYPSYTMKGTVSLWELYAQPSPVVGATAFWHKSLFEHPLTAAPMDDVLLRWILIAQNRLMEAPVWMLDVTLKTVKYAIGTGITTEVRPRLTGVLSPRERWIAQMKGVRRFQTIMARSYDGVSAYLETVYGHDEGLRAVVETLRIKAWFQAVGTWKRLPWLCRMTCLLMRRRVSSDISRSLLKSCCTRFFVELFGLRVAAFYYVRKHGDKIAK